MQIKKPVTNLKPLHDSVIFVFLDEVTEGGFSNMKTAAGIIIPRNRETDASKPRWGLVISVGSKCVDIKEDDYVLVEPLRWTTFVEVDGVKVWRTTEKDVIAVSDEMPKVQF